MTNGATGRREVSWLCMMFATVLLSSCSVFPGKQRSAPIKSYLLEPGEMLQGSPARPTKPCLSLLVSATAAAPGFATSRMAYVQQAYRLNYFADHQWIDTPAHMLGPLLVQALEHSGLFRSVAAAPLSVDAELRLESKVLRLQQVFKDGNSELQLSIRFSVIDLTRRRMLTSRVFSVTEPAPVNGPYGGVVAANRAVAHVLGKLIDFLRQQIEAETLKCKSEAASGELIVPR